MQRSEYGYANLSLPQYTAIVTNASMDGNTSPILGQANYAAFMQASQSVNIDPRVLLAGLQFESHFGTDNNGMAAVSVLNLAGIKWADQKNATDSGIKADNDGTYARFATLATFFNEYARTLTNPTIGPAFQSGDLATAWAIYVGGPDRPNVAAGQGRVQQWQFFRTHYPPQGDLAATPGVYGEDLISEFETQIGRPNSGTYDSFNGDHAWAFWCRASVEATGRNCGLTVVPHASAMLAQLAATKQGLLVTDGTAPEHGAVIQFDTRFYANDGHTGLWNATKGQMLGTLTNGTGVGYRNWGPGTLGYAGWYRLPGVVAPYRTAPSELLPKPSVNLVIPSNPFNATITDPMHQIGVGGANRTKWEGVPDALTVFGYPIRNEQQAMVYDPDGSVRQRTVQFYQRAITIYQPEQAPPWNLVVALATQRVVPIGG